MGIAIVVVIVVLVMLYWFASSGSTNVTDIKIVHPKNWLHVAEIEVWGKDGKKIPLAGSKATQSSLYQNNKKLVAGKVIDGHKHSINHSGKKGTAKFPQWLNLKLKEPVDASKVDKVVVYNRPGGLRNRLVGATISVLSGSVPLKTHLVTKGKTSYTLKL